MIIIFNDHDQFCVNINLSLTHTHSVRTFFAVAVTPSIIYRNQLGKSICFVRIDSANIHTHLSNG